MEKEAFTVMDSVERLYYLAAAPGAFDLYKKNLIFIFDLLAILLYLEKAAVCQVLRWAVCLPIQPYTGSSKSLLYLRPQLKPSNWPSDMKILKIQRRYKQSRVAKLQYIVGLYRYSSNGPM